MFIFFLFGGDFVGNLIASGNLILALAPSEKRPVYVALQMNIVSFGLFFSIVGGIILHFINYSNLYKFTLALLFLSMFLSFKLKY